MIEQIITGLRQEQLKMQETVFRTPPGDFESFCAFRGQWIGLQKAIDVIEGVVNGRRNPEDS